MSCPDCLSGAILAGTPKGITNKDGSYLAPAPEGSESKRAVLVLTDVFGLALNNPKLIADHLSEKMQCDVWVPDMFNGSPAFKVRSFDDVAMPSNMSQKMNIYRWFLFYVTLLLNLPGIIAARSSVVDKRVRDFVAKIKAEKKYESLGAIGYCFGAAVCLRLSVTTDIFDAIVPCHPGGFPLNVLDELVVPSSWVCAEEDFTFPAAMRKKTEEILVKRSKDKENAVDFEIHDYIGTRHGFATRPNLAVPEVKEAFGKHFEQTINWFNKYL